MLINITYFSHIAYVSLHRIIFLNSYANGFLIYTRLDIEDTERCYKELKCQKDEALTAVAINLVRNLDCGSKARKSQDKRTASLQNRLESVEKQMEDKFDEQAMNNKVSNRESSEVEWHCH